MEPLEDWNLDDYEDPDPNPVVDVSVLFRDPKLEPGTERKIQRVTLVGTAGSGKTVFLRRFGKYFVKNKRIVIRPEFRSYPLDEEILPSVILFSNVCENDSSLMSECFEWMQENSQSVVFLIDSLDTMAFGFDTPRPVLNGDEPTTMDVLVHNILSGNLFPKAFVISASRPQTAFTMHRSIRSDRYVGVDNLPERGVVNAMWDCVFEKEDARANRRKSGKS